jgi:hypothetical protein
LDRPNQYTEEYQTWTRAYLGRAGYHGCAPDFADALIRGQVGIDDWQPSQNPYDWLGHGIYFWEFAPHRARVWGGKGGVVGAVIQLGVCLDLTDIHYMARAKKSAIQP